MKYLVIEIQKDANEQLATLVNQYESLNEAESKFYTVMAAAAISSVPVHAAAILTEEGVLHMSKYYIHKEEEA